jgi:hypothetical protein
MIPAQSAKKRGQLSAIGDQLRPLEPRGCKHRKFFCDLFRLSSLFYRQIQSVSDTHQPGALPILDTSTSEKEWNISAPQKTIADFPRTLAA